MKNCDWDRANKNAHAQIDLKVRNNYSGKGRILKIFIRGT